MEKTSFPKFKALQWRLAVAYCGVMLAILGTFSFVVYKFFASSLYQQIDRRLLDLAQAASHDLKEIKKNPAFVGAPKERQIDQDGDLDIAWKPLRLPHQSVEWFDANGNLLATSGEFLPESPLKEGYQEDKSHQIFSLTLAIYRQKQGASVLEGYIRVSENSANLDLTFKELRWGLAIGGITGLTLMAIGGMWLTQQSLKPLEESYHQLKQFTADASHELRTPLTVIKTAIQIIETHQERIHIADLDKYRSIISATNQMTELVEDLLLLARTENRKHHQLLHPTLIPINELLEEILEFIELEAESKQITLTADTHPQVFVKGDVLQLSRLFSNLLNNALQYTPSGGKVHLSLKEQDRFIKVSVKDTGIGIAPEELPHVFDRFWRASLARSTCEFGSGLGLAIAQAIALNHGGKITVTSQLNKGSCFQVFLPIVLETNFCFLPSSLPLLSKLLNKEKY